MKTLNYLKSVFRPNFSSGIIMDTFQVIALVACGVLIGLLVFAIVYLDYIIICNLTI